MKITALAIPVLLACTATVGLAHPRLSIAAEAKAHKAGKARAIAFVGEPTARVRTGDARGLGPLAFAQWLAANHRVAGADAASLRRVSSTTSLLNLSSPLFAQADRNGDGWISATELADFIASPEEMASTGRIA